MRKQRARSLALRAHAKVNLHLDIGPRRKDGYHSLRTLFQEISLHDTLRFANTRDGSVRLSVKPRGLPTGKDNLVVRALELLRRRIGTEEGMKVHLEKRIPVGAGLGGGSSDAAAALRAGWILWKRDDRSSLPKVLFRCALELGADVPFFLRGGTAWAEGIGEKLRRLSGTPIRWLVLIYPRVHVSTKDAYALFDRSRNSTPVRTEFFNSFEPIMMKKFPRIKQVADALKRLGCEGVMMSGSGSSVFGFVKSRREGARVVRTLSKRPWDIFLVRTVAS